MKPTVEQLAEMFRQIESGRIGRSHMQNFLENPQGFLVGGLSTAYDQSLGLVPLIERAVGPANLANINGEITQERFPLRGSDVRTVKARIEPYQDGETSEEAAKRLAAAGHTLGNTGDLAGFLHDHPDEVEKWSWVLAISEDSRWSFPGGGVYVPYARVRDACRVFDLRGFRLQLSSRCGVLVVVGE